MAQPEPIWTPGGRIISSYMNAPALGMAYTDDGASTVWPSANLGFKIRLFNARAFTPTHAFWKNGAAVAGNVDVGVYEPDSETLIAQLDGGAEAQAGVNAMQFDAFTTPIPAGYVDIAISLSDGATATLFAQTETVVRAMAASQMAAAHVLPATWVPADPSNFAAILPLFGFLDRAY
jgi:hypothetical protein